MNKEELVSAVAESTKVTKKEISNVIDALVETVQGAVAQGQTIQLVGFGTFKAAKRAARTGRNPKTGETLTIAEKTIPVFKAGKSFKELVNA